MRGNTDRLAVSTYLGAGEEIAFGQWGVSDAERSAAGRETVAERFAALLPGNRSRAAAQYAEGGWPEGLDLVRVWTPRDPAGLRARLGTSTRAVWADGDVLHVLWRGRAAEVRLHGGVQPQLWPVSDTDDLWEASLRIRRLDEAMISIVVAHRADGEDWAAQTPESEVWRGPRAPAPSPWAVPGAPAADLRGTVTEHTLDSTALRGPRQVTVYCPPQAGRPLPACVLADGESARPFAAGLEAAIMAGTVPPLLLVGVHNDHSQLARRSDRRAQEYLPGHNRRRFDAHLSFVTDEVMPWAAGSFGPVAGPWVAAGFSNGAAWAIGAAQRRPELIGAVAGLSAGIVPGRISGPARAARVRHYLAAGMLEPGFRRSTRHWAERLQRAGMPCEYAEWAGGHDHLWWEQQLPVALGWLLGA